MVISKVKSHFHKMYTKEIQMVQNQNLQVDGRSGGLEISPILWNRKFHYIFHISPQQDTILSQINPVYTLILYLSALFILILFYELCLYVTKSWITASQNFPHPPDTFLLLV